MQLSYIGPGSGFGHASPVVFLLLLAVAAVVWSAVLVVLARAMWRRFARTDRP